MASYPHHESLHLKNFTAFADAAFEFSPTINVLVGENGTGKTHLMKVLYAIQYVCSRIGKPSDIESVLQDVFQEFMLSELHREAQYEKHTNVTNIWNGKEFGFFISTSEPDAMFICDLYDDNPKMSRSVFVPAIDMIGHTNRFISTFDQYRIDFDRTYRDIVSLLLAPELKQPSRNPEIVHILASLLGGTVEEQGERFYLRTPQGRQPMPLVAEGLRKIATLYQLLRNGFLEPGSVLFWDEPEGNVNPKLMDEIVDVLLRLARSGVQIFLATHSYVLLKEFDIQARADDAVRYFALEQTDAGTVAHATDDYTQIHPNPIAEQFDYIYDRELTRAIKGGA